MSDLRERLEKLSPKRLLLLAMELQSRLDTIERERSEPIAIVGVGCRIPGTGRGTRAFWHLLSNGEDGITQVPSDRWDASAWYDADPDSPGRTSTTWAVSCLMSISLTLPFSTFPRAKRSAWIRNIGCCLNLVGRLSKMPGARLVLFTEVRREFS